MCIIVYKPKGKNLKKEIYQNCFDNNKEGAGFIIREKTGELKLEKGFFTFQDFWEHFQPHQHKQAVVHFRIATHGKTDQENCHPFWLRENKLAFAHNGVMNNVDCSPDESKSDTWHFNVSMLQHLQEKMGEEFIFDAVLQSLISEFIGDSRLAFMHEDGRVLIFNKKKGVVEDDVWFSNYSFRSWKPKKQKYKQSWQDAYNRAANSTSYVPPVNVNKPVIPVRLAPPPMSSTIRINDYVEMIQPYKDLTGNEFGEVIAIYGNRTAEIKLYDSRTPTGWKIRNLPFEVFQLYYRRETTEDEESRDYEKESVLLTAMQEDDPSGNVVEGQVIAKEISTDMSQITKLENRNTETLEEAACNDLREMFKENFLH